MLCVCTGKKALFALKLQKPDFVKKVFKCSIFSVVLMVLSCMFIHHHAKQAKTAYRSYQTRHNREYLIHYENDEEVPEHLRNEHHRSHFKLDEEVPETPRNEHHRKHLMWGRNLAEVCHDSTEATCNNQNGCTWCKSGAIPSACYTEEESMKLPAGVFMCESAAKVKKTEKPKPKPHYIHFWEKRTWFFKQSSSES
jgi:hypothetical protein